MYIGLSQMCHSQKTDKNIYYWVKYMITCGGLSVLDSFLSFKLDHGPINSGIWNETLVIYVVICHLTRCRSLNIYYQETLLSNASNRRVHALVDREWLITLTGVRLLARYFSALIGWLMLGRPPKASSSPLGQKGEHTRVQWLFSTVQARIYTYVLRLGLECRRLSQCFKSKNACTYLGWLVLGACQLWRLVPETSQSLRVHILNHGRSPCAKLIGGF